MKVWTCGNSPRSGYRNAWTRIKNVNVANRLSKFGIFFDAMQMISCRDWWPWKKPGYSTKTRRQSNYQWCGGIAVHHVPENLWCTNPLENYSPRFFWDQDGILLIDYLPKGQTINADHYSFLLVQMKDILKEKRPGKVIKWVLLLHNNSPSSPDKCNPEKLADLGFQCLDHSLYSPDLAPSDYHLFPNLKNQLKGRHFSSDAEVIAAAKNWLDGQYSDFF